MKKQFAQLLVISLLSLGVFSCKKVYDDKSLSPLQDSVTDIPITVPNQVYFERFPIVTASVSNVAGSTIGPFTIVLQIPADKGKIKEITKITTGTSGLANLQSTADNLAFNYDAATSRVVPIPGNGSNQITFSSSLDKYTLYRTRVGAANAGQPAVVAPTSAFNAQNPNQLPYYFLITLEDGRQLVSTAIRVRVID